MFRTFVVSLILGLMFVPGTATASSATIYQGTYEKLTYYCEDEAVTVGDGSPVIGGRWQLNATPAGAQIVSIVFEDGRLHAAVAWTGPTWQMQPVAGSHDPDNGRHHYAVSVGHVRAEVLLTPDGDWFYTVGSDTWDCAGSEANSPFDSAVVQGTRTR